MTPFVDDTDFTLYVGDVRDVLRELPDESVHCVVTSPPYWGLRDYGTGQWDGGDPDCDHSVRLGDGGSGEAAPGYASPFRAGKEYTHQKVTGNVCKCGARRVDQQLGLEPTPDAYVARMVQVFREVRRVLRKDGTCWLNLGDSYASSPPGNVAGVGATSGLHGANDASGVYRETLKAGHATKRNTVVGGLKPKDLVGIPWRVAFALQADGWYLRSDIIWAKPNPMPESVTDRPTKSHEYLFLLTRSARYFYDADAIRQPLAEKTLTVREGPTNYAYANDEGGNVKTANWNNSVRERTHNHAGANARSVWEIATQPYAEAHFATFPEELARRCIAAGTSEHGCCPECGAPWERIVEATGGTIGKGWHNHEDDLGRGQRGGDDGTNVAAAAWKTYKRESLGWCPTCDCRDKAYHDPDSSEPGAAVPCVVLDPFMGSGTTAHVARKLGRRSIGIELNPEYAQLCARRLQQLSLLA